MLPSPAKPLHRSTGTSTLRPVSLLLSLFLLLASVLGTSAAESVAPPSALPPQVPELVSAQQQAPPDDVVGVTAAAEPLTLKCKDNIIVDDKRFDFKQLLGLHDPVYADVEKITSYHFAINVCDKLTEPADCEGGRVCQSTDVYHPGEKLSGDTKFAGNEAPTLEVSDGASPETVTLKFPGLGEKLVTMVLTCSEKKDLEPHLDEKTGNSLKFSWQTPSACSKKVDKDTGKPKEGSPDGSPAEGTPAEGTPEKKGGMSALGIFFLIVFIGFIVYFAVGIYYNHTVYGAHGWDLIPHADFWRELPSLTADVLRHAYNSLFNRGASGYSSMA